MRNLQNLVTFVRELLCFVPIFWSTESQNIRLFFWVHESVCLVFSSHCFYFLTLRVIETFQSINLSHFEIHLCLISYNLISFRPPSHSIITFSFQMMEDHCEVMKNLSESILLRATLIFSLCTSLIALPLVVIAFYSLSCAKMSKLFHINVIIIFQVHLVGFFFHCFSRWVTKPSSLATESFSE